MIRTGRRLADGREILYFDAVQHTRPDSIDVRQLPDRNVNSEIRFDRLLGEWVVIAAHRQTRTQLPDRTQCPLCPSRPGSPTEIPASDYEVVVFENRFAALPGVSTDSSALADHVAGSAPTSPTEKSGRSEVVCFSSEHDTTSAQLGVERTRMVIDVLAERTTALRAMPAVSQVFCFENFGAEIGVTLSHPHGQIYALPFTSPRAAKIEANARRYRDEHNRNLFGDMFAAERDSGVRVVCANDEWTAFVPTAARWPYEVLLFPNRRVADIPELDDHARTRFAELYLDVLGRFERRFDEPMPYIAAWNQAPKGAEDFWWLHLQIFSIRRAPGKLKYLAGAESGMGVFISDTTPENVAAELRAVTP